MACLLLLAHTAQLAPRVQDGLRLDTLLLGEAAMRKLALRHSKKKLFAVEKGDADAEGINRTIAKFVNGDDGVVGAQFLSGKSICQNFRRCRFFDLADSSRRENLRRS